MRTPRCDQLGIDVPILASSHYRNVVAEASKDTHLTPSVQSSQLLDRFRPTSAPAAGLSL
jgi:hypothetical protein